MNHLVRTVEALAFKRGLSAYAISKQCGGNPTAETVKRFLDGKSAINSDHLARICDVLGLRLKER